MLEGLCSCVPQYTGPCIRLVTLGKTGAWRLTRGRIGGNMGGGLGGTEDAVSDGECDEERL